MNYRQLTAVAEAPMGASVEDTVKGLGEAVPEVALWWEVVGHGQSVLLSVVPSNNYVFLYLYSLLVCCTPT